ncbi:MAG: putative selenate ABC transporter substrate-binding protein [Dehalococcoidia bacterium]|nr:putative selenate ABC transporter substrate-binding protein [Dehalococcoidia bacterium]MSQ16128.1 putative selenate ABC transporter substrate-binding protein [Dehalococcoidia bacterium]
MFQRFSARRLVLVVFSALILAAGIVACGPAVAPTPAAPAATPAPPTLKIGGIPDQNAATLARRYDSFAAYMSKELGVQVQYVPSVDYAAVVTAFTQGELQLAFFGGLTGAQARLQNPGALAIVQRENDAKFHSRFIVRSELPVKSLEELKTQAKSLTITFGSESSTSGHLMPRHFLVQAGIDPATAFKTVPNFSGSHDLTWQLVQSGSFDVGALNEDVWTAAVKAGKIDPAKVREFYTTPEYVDYHWLAHPGLDKTYGAGFTSKAKQALLKLNLQENKEILGLFATQKFIETSNANYQPIEQIGRNLGIIK